MKISLLDVNMLIALAWPSHVNHHDAHFWFTQNSPAGWATCPMTQCGFVRISSNPKIISDAVSPKEAIAVLKDIVSHVHHSFWADDAMLCDSEHMPMDLVVGHRQITDAYLLGLAVKNDGKLATFDKRVSSLLKKNSPFHDSLEIVPTE